MQVVEEEAPCVVQPTTTEAYQGFQINTVLLHRQPGPGALFIQNDCIYTMYLGLYHNILSAVGAPTVLAWREKTR